MKKILLVGSGLSASVIANKLSENDCKITIIEKRDHIGGNVFDKKISGITTHIYGPHIFHTSDEKVFEYISKFTKFNNYVNTVNGKVLNKLIPIPFNFAGIDTFFTDEKDEIKQKLIHKYGEGKRIPILQLMNDEDLQLKNVANFIYKNIFENYTTKMWGLSPIEIDKSVTARVPIVIGYSKKYFSDTYEGIPVDGYTSIINNMLNHPNITIKLNQNANDCIRLDNGNIYFNDELFDGELIYTGPIDELFGYEFGSLNYRSLNIIHETVQKEFFQEYPVINLPSDPKFTRITEYKHMTNEKNKYETTITYEEPGQFKLDSILFGERYYPISTNENEALYNKYLLQTKKYPSLHLVGRLATYKYINMDKCISLALDVAERLLGK